MAGTLQPCEGRGHHLVGCIEVFGPWTRHIAGPEGAMGVHQTGDAIAAETPIGLGMALGTAHVSSVDSPIPSRRR